MSNVVILDACVLFPASLRDTLLRAAGAGMYRLGLTAEILEEVRRNLVKKVVPDENARQLVAAINSYFSDAFIYGYEPLIPAMPLNEKDRHVLAAAVACKAQIIVTQNLRDFPDYLLNSFGIEAQSSDKFLVSLFLIIRKRWLRL